MSLSTTCSTARADCRSSSPIPRQAGSSPGSRTSRHFLKHIKHSSARNWYNMSNFRRIGKSQSYSEGTTMSLCCCRSNSLSPDKPGRNQKKGSDQSGSSGSPSSCRRDRKSESCCRKDRSQLRPSSSRKGTEDRWSSCRSGTRLFRRASRQLR